MLKLNMANQCELLLNNLDWSSEHHKQMAFEAYKIILSDIPQYKKRLMSLQGSKKSHEISINDRESTVMDTTHKNKTDTFKSPLSRYQHLR